MEFPYEPEETEWGVNFTHFITSRTMSSTVLVVWGKDHVSFAFILTLSAVKFSSMICHPCFSITLLNNAKLLQATVLKTSWFSGPLYTQSFPISPLIKPYGNFLPCFPSEHLLPFNKKNLFGNPQKAIPCCHHLECLLGYIHPQLKTIWQSSLLQIFHKLSTFTTDFIKNCLFLKLFSHTSDVLH
jgi:hypothetical protein